MARAWGFKCSDQIKPGGWGGGYFVQFPDDRLPEDVTPHENAVEEELLRVLEDEFRVAEDEIAFWSNMIKEAQTRCDTDCFAAGTEVMLVKLAGTHNKDGELTEDNSLWTCSKATTLEIAEEMLRYRCGGEGDNGESGDSEGGGEGDGESDEMWLLQDDMVRVRSVSESFRDAAASVGATIPGPGEGNLRTSKDIHHETTKSSGPHFFVSVDPYTQRRIGTRNVYLKSRGKSKKQILEASSY